MTYNYKVLVVEDSEDSYEILTKVVPGESKIYWAQTLSQGKRLLAENRFDLILVDLMLPDGSGYDIGVMAQSSPKNQDVPLMYISARHDISDKVMGFSAGGDDYVEKPFNVIELRARIEAKLRKMKIVRSTTEQVDAGPIHIDLKRHEVRLDPDNRALDLTPIEFKILQLLTSEAGQVFPREDILNHVWGENVHVYPRSVDTHVSKVRKKLGDYKDMIQSVHGSGYKIDLARAEQPPTAQAQ